MRRSTRLVPLLLATVGAAAVAGGITVLGRPAAEPLPSYWRAPDFALIDQHGDTLRAAELEGTAWVAGFIFTHCTDVCPTITARMARLRDRLGDAGWLGGRVRLVSVTVDPERDSPAVLRAYAERFGGSPPAEWAFLTGSPPEAVRRLVQEGFHLTAVTMPSEDGHDQVMHSPRLLLVDAAGTVRGLYDALEPASVDSITADLRALLD